MFWVIRGTDPRTQQDFAFVVEATSQPAAEAWAVKRGIGYVFIGEAERVDVAEARQQHRLWRYSPRARYQCFGHAVAKKQLACLLLAGIATMGLVLTRTVRNPSRLLSDMGVSSTRAAPRARPIPSRSASPAPSRPQSTEIHSPQEPREV